MKDIELPLSEHACLSESKLDIKGKIVDRATYTRSGSKIRIYFKDGSRLSCLAHVEQDWEFPTITKFDVIPSYFQPNDQAQSPEQ